LRSPILLSKILVVFRDISTEHALDSVYLISTLYRNCSFILNLYAYQIKSKIRLYQKRIDLNMSDVKNANSYSCKIFYGTAL